MRNSQFPGVPASAQGRVIESWHLLTRRFAIQVEDMRIFEKSAYVRAADSLGRATSAEPVLTQFWPRR